jgi:hypothetical protein
MRSEGKGSAMKLDTREGKALYEAYPKTVRHPDLLVTHIGSIEPEAFR